MGFNSGFKGLITMAKYGKFCECVSITVLLVKTYLKNSVRNWKANRNNKEKKRTEGQIVGELRMKTEVWRKDSGVTKRVWAIAIHGDGWWGEIILTLNLKYFSETCHFLQNFVDLHLHLHAQPVLQCSYVYEVWKKSLTHSGSCH